MAASEKKGGRMTSAAGAVRSLQSGLASKNREKWAEFAYLVESKGRNSLQSRLSGGADSLALTILRPNSLLTGKNTGNSRVLAPRNRTPVLQLAHSAGENAAKGKNGTGN